MKQDIKKEWVRRLRSGDYKQGTEQLCKNDEFCCLGVLDEMGAEAGIVNKEVQKDKQVFYRDPINGSISTALLGHALRAWSGLAYNNVIYKEKPDSLVHMNDRGVPFSEIADVIEEVF